METLKLVDEIDRIMKNRTLGQIKNTEIIQNSACGDEPCPAVQGPYEGCFAVPSYLKDAWKWNEVIFRSALMGQGANVFAPVIKEDFSLVGKEGETLKFLRYNQMNLNTFTAGCSDDATTGGNDYTCNATSNNLSSAFSNVTMTLNKTTEKSTRIDVDRYDEESTPLPLAKAIGIVIQDYIVRLRNASITTAFQNPAVTKRVYGGNATSVATLQAGDCMSHDALKRVRTYFVSMGYPIDSIWGFIPPIQAEHLTNEYGGANAAFADEIKYGKVPMRAGIKLVETPFCPSYLAGQIDVNEGTAYPVAAGVAIFAAQSPTSNWNLDEGPPTAPVALGWKKLFELEVFKEKCRKNVYEATWNMGAALVNECPVVLGKFACECPTV